MEFYSIEGWPTIFPRFVSVSLFIHDSYRSNNFHATKMLVLKIINNWEITKNRYIENSVQQYNREIIRIYNTQSINHLFIPFYNNDRI